MLENLYRRPLLLVRLIGSNLDRNAVRSEASERARACAAKTTLG